MTEPLTQLLPYRWSTFELAARSGVTEQSCPSRDTKFSEPEKASESFALENTADSEEKHHVAR